MFGSLSGTLCLVAEARSYAAEVPSPSPSGPVVRTAYPEPACSLPPGIFHRRLRTKYVAQPSTAASVEADQFSRAASVPQTPIDPYEIYLPSAEAYAESTDNFLLPEHLRLVIDNISQDPGAFFNPLKMADQQPKHADTVDYGEEFDYSGYEWFKDPPPPRPTVCSFPRRCALRCAF